MNAVALNCRFSGTLQPMGTQTAAFELFDAIIRLPERAAPLVIFADPTFPGVAAWAEVRDVTFVSLPFSTWSRARAQWWEQFTLPGLCRKMGCAVAHHPITTCPFLTRGVKNVVTLHDLDFLSHPEWYPRSFRAVYTFTAIPGLMSAWRVVAISEYVRQEAATRLGIEQDHILRVYNGVRFLSDGADDADSGSPAQSDVPYILCVGALRPRKNLARLILAFRQLRERYPDLELRIAGRAEPGFSEMPGLLDLLATPNLQFLGYLSDDDLRAAYANAQVFCYPSLDEGFGLPMLEAMACGTLVVASNTSCLPEIAGGHAELIDPLSPDSIAAGIQSILDLTPEQRAQRISRARAWAEGFNWQQAAWSYLAIYQELM
jgi:glycosyltransferase involved in cell wall biosynthesis